MKAFAKNIFLSLLLVFSSLASIHAADVSGALFPDAINVNGEQLTLNGYGLLKKFLFVKVYLIGLYLKEPTSSASIAISSDETKRMVIHMQHDVAREKFVQTVEENIKRNSGPAMPALRARLDRLERSLPTLRRGDALSFTYEPDQVTTMRCHDRELKIEGKDFAVALFSIWLGPHPVNNNLKRDLLGQRGD